jgi:acyl-coenzyme A synthetase/AMP-(fatty) acid ligase
MRAMDARAMLFEMRFIASAHQARAALPQVDTLVAIGDNRLDWALEYEALVVGASSAEPEVEIEEHDPYYFNLTSGTTGLPKFYVLSRSRRARRRETPSSAHRATSCRRRRTWDRRPAT